MDGITKSVRCVKYALICAVLKALSLIKISFIVGSQTAFFNGSSFSVPFVGFFAGPWASLLLFLMRLGNWCFFTSQSLHLLAFVVPGFCASLYWTSKNSFIRLWLPLLCMCMFIAHPVGHDACLYTVYWLIPVVLYFAKRHNIWLESLGSTFVAHAVGSVIWVYTMPTTASLWLLLIPVVAVERLLCMAAMVVLCYGYRLIDLLFDVIHVRIYGAIQQYKQV